MDHNTPDQITCATIQSMHKYPFDPSEVKTLIVDEVHECKLNKLWV
jgi:superfamily II DNA or RNA helicase